jgi:hypothetical protein
LKGGTVSRGPWVSRQHAWRPGGDGERERIDKKIGKIRKEEGVGERGVEGLGGGRSR